MSRVRIALLASLAVTLLAGAGCGSSSGSSSSAASTPASTPTSTPTSTASTGTGSGGSSFCGQARSDFSTLQADLAGLASISSTPQRLKATLQTVIAAYQQAEQQAPDQIKPDIATVSTFMSQLNHAFAAHSYDAMQAAPTALPILKSAKLKAAFAHLKAWGVANCGMSP
ncbi:MAG: hypothetical protein QOG33_1633 [Gaiellales bacterium]|jgi:hypothetical protein|nr:hypothetical protein [Gaiellales bacterium]